MAWTASADLAVLGTTDRLAGKLVHINVTRQRIKDDPPYDPSITVDGAYEEMFLMHYGIRWVAA